MTNQQLLVKINNTYKKLNDFTSVFVNGDLSDNEKAIISTVIASINYDLDLGINRLGSDDIDE